MMTSPRHLHDVAGNFTSRRGHTNQLSISDPSHHVTEAIGTLYGDEDDSGSEGGRPLSFIGGSSYQEQIHRPLQHPQYPHHHYNHDHDHDHDRDRDHGHNQHRQNQQNPLEFNDPRRQLTRSMSDEPAISTMPPSDSMSLRKTQTLPVPGPGQRNSFHDQNSKPPLSPTLSLRDVKADAAGSQFPLTNIDNPNDIAQELSNLQALRRLSMDVGYNIDPDMPPMSLSSMPVIAPTGNDDESDPSRLLWVPARVHPELAPTEFKTFLEKRVQSIRRRSGESLLSADNELNRIDSSPGSLSRKRSMLSRQIDNAGGRGAVGYVDGAERLDRQRIRNNQSSTELSLDELVRDPTKAVQKLTQESQSQAIGIDGSGDDMPILPMAPGVGLRRSTRTTYRKGGSLRAGDRAPFSKRVAQRQQENGNSDLGKTDAVDAPHGHTLARVQSEPVRENYSRPTRSVRRQYNFSQDVSHEGSISSTSMDNTSQQEEQPNQFNAHSDSLPVRKASNSSTIEPTTSTELSNIQDSSYPKPFPQRSSSQSSMAPSEPQTDHATEETSSWSSRRTASGATNKSQASSSSPQPLSQQQKEHMPSANPSVQLHAAKDSPAASSSSLLGVDASRTDNLTFIPTLTQDEKKVEKRSKRDRDDESIAISTKSSSAWKWFKGVTDDKEKKKEESKKSKAKALAEKSQDNTRLDVIQTSIDKTNSKTRESLALDRDSIDGKLQEERKKDSNRKSDIKKEKDGSIFSSLFGGSKRKEDKEKGTKKSQHLQVPEHAPYKPLQADIDYNWSRFPLLEERAIYRMAHIKLANPRRSLLSQVLLSNFMYSYLAIVQAMHPQMNVPISPQQKRLEEEARRKQQEEEYLARQQMQEEHDAQHSLDQYNFDYHRATIQYADSSSDGQVDYVDDAQIYEDEHGKDRRRDFTYDGSETYGQDVKEYFQYRDDDQDRQGEGHEDMW